MSELAGLIERYTRIRQTTVNLCEPLENEDYVVQCMADASPPKWHLAHTTWFFETFLLQEFQTDYQPFDPRYNFLFNSYYRSVGEFHRRPNRGSLSRPTVDQIMAFRRHVDSAVVAYLSQPELADSAKELVRVGLHHEQQHQELMLMDIKYNFSQNPLNPAYQSGPRPDCTLPKRQPVAPEWKVFDPQLVTIGANDVSSFHFDNEQPVHKNYLPGHKLRTTLVTNREYLAFIEDGGYDNCLLWLADGFDYLKEHQVTAPEYWRPDGAGGFLEFQLTGQSPLDLDAPVQHVSYYEADAFARWADCRLATEAEWEHTCLSVPQAPGHFLQPGGLVPRPQTQPDQIDLLGNLWEWTRTAYHAYPGYRVPAGAIGEYNAKFMAGTMVARGGSYLSPADHIRPTYRNFFYPHMRWQPVGIRLAKDHQP